MAARSSSFITEFIGREEELALLRAWLDQACAGTGGIVLLAGEPGIGKTRTAEELAADARLREARVLWGRCYEGEGAPAFWPWVQLIRAYLRDREPAPLRTELGAGAADIAQLVPELRQQVPGLPEPQVLEPTQARFRLFESVTAFLTAAAARQPLVLILDDLHWADRPSLLLLQFLAQEIRAARLLVLGTYRDVEVGHTHPLAETLAALVRQPVSQRLRLTGLDAREVARFIEVTADLEPPDDLVAAVTRETEGNPFFVVEVVRLLLLEDRLRAPEPARPWRPTIPPSVRDVIGRRLARLSERCHRLLTVAAVIGQEFSLEPLQRASQVESEAVLEALEEAEMAHVIAPLGRTLGRYTFSHALVRETLYEALPAARRLRLHGQVGAALEAVYGADRDAHLAELAHHFVQAAPAGDATRAVDYARQAGERAMALLAYEEAAEHFRRALEVVEARAAGEIPLRCNLLLALGEALRRAGEPHPALERFQHAADLARRLVAPDLLAQAALGFEDAVLPAGLPRSADADPSVALLEESLRVLDPAPSAVRARVLAALARALVFTGARLKGATLSRQAVDLARQTGDPAAVVYALDAHRIAIWGPDHPGQRLAVASEIARLAEEIGDKEMALNGRLWRQHALLERGEVVAAEAEIAAFARLAEESRQPLYRCYVPLLQANHALLRGQFAEVERLAAQALDLGRRAHSENAAMIHTAQLLLLRREQARITEVKAALRDFAAQSPWVPTFSAALAVIAGEQGRQTEARALFEDLAVRDFTGIARTYVWLLNMAFLVEVCAALDDTRRAAVLYRLLLPYAGQHILGSSAGPSWGLTARYLGLLAGMLRRWEAGAQHFEAALAAHEEIGARPWLARTRYDYARVLLARGRSADRSRAADLLGQALAAAQEIGMPRLAGQVLDLLDRHGGALAGGSAQRTPPRPAGEGGRRAAYPDDLTERQVEILHLLAEGRSNREIAAALSLSVRTVEHHVAHIYAKIGASGRVEATAYALRHGLMSADPRPD